MLAKKNTPHRFEPNLQSQHPYGVLGIPLFSEEPLIKEAYRTLVKQYHPDTHTHPNEKETAATVFKVVCDAYQQLDTPEKRYSTNAKLRILLKTMAKHVRQSGKKHAHHVAENLDAMLPPEPVPPVVPSSSKASVTATATPAPAPASTTVSPARAVSESPEGATPAPQPSNEPLPQSETTNAPISSTPLQCRPLVHWWQRLGRRKHCISVTKTNERWLGQVSLKEANFHTPQTYVLEISFVDAGTGLPLSHLESTTLELTVPTLETDEAASLRLNNDEAVAKIAVTLHGLESPLELGLLPPKRRTPPPSTPRPSKVATASDVKTTSEASVALLHQLTQEADRTTASVTLRLEQALFGGELTLQPPHGGEPIVWTLPAGVQVGQVVRLKGQGLPSPEAPENRQDLYITVQIPLPACDVQQQAALLQLLKALPPQG
ncbi:MAG: DnaJ domain-containing protein [Vampirovibrionales bacterium]